ncbi:MAG: DUF5671 domain-containing protein [Pseudomonadota bacterium]
MSVAKELARFTRDALQSGKSRDEIRAALNASGWSEREIKKALSAWSDEPFDMPIPRPQSTLSARDFFVYFVMFGALIMGAISLVTLLHDLIDMQFGDAQLRFLNMRWDIAVLLVLTPLYILLEVRETRAIRTDPALLRSAIRRWWIYITLLFAVGALLGSLMNVVYRLLEGDLSVQFVLKMLVIVMIAAFFMLYYFKDVQRGEDG